MDWCSKCFNFFYTCSGKSSTTFRKRCLHCGGDHDSWNCPRLCRFRGRPFCPGNCHVRDPHRPHLGQSPLFSSQTGESQKGDTVSWQGGMEENHLSLSRHFRIASSMNPSGSSFANNSSTRFFGKRIKRTLLSSSAETYFLRNGLRISHAFFFSFFALWMNSSQRSLSPLMVMISFMNIFKRGASL